MNIFSNFQEAKDEADRRSKKYKRHYAVTRAFPDYHVVPMAMATIFSNLEYYTC